MTRSLTRRAWLLVVLAAVVAGAACDAFTAATPLPVVSVTPPPGPTGPLERARVVRVVDGDTIVVDLGGREDRVRYIGIDAPESVRPNTPVEPFAREAAAENAALVRGRNVLLERDVSERDAFGRLLRYVWVEPTGDGPPLFVNFELVARGFANAATYPPDVRNAELFNAAEREARQWGRGLWSDAGRSPSALPAGE